MFSIILPVIETCNRCILSPRQSPLIKQLNSRWINWPTGWEGFAVWGVFALPGWGGLRVWLAGWLV